MNIKNLTRVLLIVLCLVMTVSTFAACGNKDNNDDSTTTTLPPVVDNGPDWETDADGYAVTTIPEEVDYNGKEAGLLLYKDVYLYPDQLRDGEDIRNDIYLRNKQIEYDLHIEFVPTTKASHMSSGDDATELYDFVLNGEGEFEAICCYSLYPAKMAIEGVLYDINSLEYPTTEMPWFASDIQEWSIMDRLFFVAGNSSIRNLTAVWVVYANRTMIDGKGLENVEDVVIRGDWTLEKMQEYSRKWKDDAQSAPGSVYGVFVYHRTAADAFYTAAGFRAMRRDSEGMPAYAFTSATDSELIDGFIDDLLVMLKSPECGVGKYNGGTIQPLDDSTAAFFVGGLNLYGHIEEDGAYSIIPMPKYEQGQKYTSIRDNAFNTWCVSHQATDPQLGGLIIEAITYNDYRVIAPKFWDMDFKYRYSNSDTGVQIFEIIRDSVNSDFGRMYQSNIGSPFGIVRNCFYYDKTQPTADLTNIWADYLGPKVVEYETRLIDLKTVIRELFDEN